MDFSAYTGWAIPEGNVVEITDASGRVIWSATIKFTINGDTYIADRGMTWAEWFASAYNTTGKTADDVSSISANGAAVELSAVIVGGTAYEVGFAPPFVCVLDFGTVTGNGTDRINVGLSLTPDKDEMLKCNILIIDGIEYQVNATNPNTSLYQYKPIGGGKPYLDIFELFGTWVGELYLVSTQGTHTAQLGYYEL